MNKIFERKHLLCFRMNRFFLDYYTHSNFSNCIENKSILLLVMQDYNKILNNLWGNNNNNPHIQGCTKITRYTVM